MSKNDKPYSVETIAPNVHAIRMNVRSGWEQWALLRTDAHHDHSHCDQALEKKHLDLARKRNAFIIDGGDCFCAMQGKWDKRADQDALREELRGNDYLNRLVKYNSDFYAPYADMFAVASPGNHETSVLKRHGYNLTQAFTDKLGIRMGTYSGWVRFQFTINGTKRKSDWLYRHHGYGGGGAVTKGVIQTNRMAVYLPDAKFVMTGHTHDQWIVPIERHRVNDAGNTYLDRQWHVRCGGYKDEFSGGEGWHVETGKEPKPKGAVWLRMFAAEGPTIEYELTPAT